MSSASLLKPMRKVREILHLHSEDANAHDWGIPLRVIRRRLPTGGQHCHKRQRQYKANDFFHSFHGYDHSFPLRRKAANQAPTVRFGCGASNCFNTFLFSHEPVKVSLADHRPFTPYV